MTINDILLDEELAELVEDYENDVDFMSQEVTYEVWAFGYDENDEITDAELCMFTSTDPEEAIKYAKSVELADIIHGAGNGPCASSKVFRIAIEVETVIEIDGDLTNVGTIYSKTVWEQETFDGPEDEDDDCEIIDLSAEDFEILPDNTLKVNCFALKGYNKNDSVMVRLFGTELETFPLQYIIKSRVMYEDGDYYHCELEY